MITQPRLEYRSEQHFVAIRAHVPIPFGKLLPPLWEEARNWLTQRGLAPSGAPIIRYVTCDMAEGLDIEVGFPVAGAVAGDARVSFDAFPAGRYAVLLYTGSFRGKGLMKATAALLDWGKENQVVWQTSNVAGVEWWRARFESYLTDPKLEPDPKKWQTKLVFLTTGG